MRWLLLLLVGCTATHDEREPIVTTEFLERAAATDPLNPNAHGTTIFDPDRVARIELTIDPAWLSGWREQIPFLGDGQWRADNPDEGFPFRPAQMSFDGGPAIEVALRPKGGDRTIRESVPWVLPFKIDIDRYRPGQTLDGLIRLNLNPSVISSTGLEESVSYALMRELGIPASRTGFADVFLNGELLGWYATAEEVDQPFLDLRLTGEGTEGDLYKPNVPAGSLQYFGDQIDDYYQIGHELQDDTDHAALLHMIDVLNHGSFEQLDEVLHIDEVLRYFAGHALVGNLDNYVNGHNYWLYELTPGRFTLFPWDLNGSQQPTTHACGKGRQRPEIPYDFPLTERLLGDADTVHRYKQILEEFRAGSVERQRELFDLFAGTLGSGRVDPEAVERQKIKVEWRDQALAETMQDLVICPLEVTEFPDFSRQEEQGRQP